jgi:hypothetical protein
MNPCEWKEDQQDEKERYALQHDSPYHLKRRLYPLSVKLKSTSKLYAGASAGRIYMFGRPRLIAASFPIEVLHWDERGQRMYMSFAPHEAELLPAQD